MARTGRPPAPLEERLRRGRSPGRDSGGRKLPDGGAVMVLRESSEPPEPPADLGEAGSALWAGAWSEGVTWLQSVDYCAVELACRLADVVTLARERYYATGDRRDGSALLAASKVLMEFLSVLGFTPTARSRLGVSAVRTRSQLEELLERRRERGRNGEG